MDGESANQCACSALTLVYMLPSAFEYLGTGSPVDWESEGIDSRLYGCWDCDGNRAPRALRLPQWHES